MFVWRYVYSYIFNMLNVPSVWLVVVPLYVLVKVGTFITLRAANCYENINTNYKETLLQDFPLILNICFFGTIWTVMLATGLKPLPHTSVWAVNKPCTHVYPSASRVWWLGQVQIKSPANAQQSCEHLLDDGQSERETYWISIKKRHHVTPLWLINYNGTA